MVVETIVVGEAVAVVSVVVVGEAMVLVV